MIVVSGTIEIDAAQAGPAVEAATAVAEETRKEPGCRFYAFYQALENPGLFRVFEEWDDEAALKAHFETPHMASFRKVLGGIGIICRDVTLYRVSGSEAL